MNFQIVLTACAIVFGSTANAAMKSVCYTNGGGLAASNFNPSLCTHIIHTFLQPDASGNILNPQSVTGYLATLVALKSQNPNLKVLMAFGGFVADNTAWVSMAANPNAINNFATKALAFVKSSNIDGIDIDWEYPNSGGDAPTQKTNFASLLKQLRITLGSSYLLSAAIGAGQWRVGVSYDVPAIFGACDFVNVMTYDYNGWQSNGPVGHNAPLYKGPNDVGDQLLYNVDAFMSFFLPLAGVDKSKIIMGVPTYGKVFTLTSSSTAPHSPGTPAGDENYISICKKVNLKQYTSVQDNVQKAAYAFAGQTWVGYESPATAAIKAQYIKDKNLGGAMFWSLNGDDYSNVCGGGKFPIISTVVNIINGGTAPVTQTPTQTPATTTTTTKASGGAFVCPRDGLFKNPTDCNKFYNCANNIAYLMACPAGLFYNSAIGGCDWTCV